MRPFLALISAVIFFVFIFFSYLVSQELFTQLDFDTSVRIQDKFSLEFIGPFSLLSLIGSVEITGILWFGLLGFSLAAKKWMFALSLIALIFISFVIEIYGKLFLLHPGPPFMFFRTQLPFSFPSTYIHTDYSYPSGHSIRTAFFITVFLFFVANKFKGSVRLFLQATLIAFLAAMLISRIYLGEHWVTDVIGGALLGASFGIMSGLALTGKKVVATPILSSTERVKEKLPPSRPEPGGIKKPAD